MEYCSVVCIVAVHWLEQEYTLCAAGVQPELESAVSSWSTQGEHQCEHCALCSCVQLDCAARVQLEVE